MATKSLWDAMDKLEGRKGSSFHNMQQERKRQGYDKKKEVAKKMSKHKDHQKTYGNATVGK